MANLYTDPERMLFTKRVRYTRRLCIALLAFWILVGLGAYHLWS